jgi:hypothetical protein
MPETVDAPVVHEPEKASFFEDLVDIIIAPAKVFARRVDAGVFLTIILFTALALALAFANRGAMGPAVDAEIERAIATMMEQNPQMNADQLGPVRSWMGFMMTYGIAIGLPIYFLLVALGVWLVGKLFGAPLTYGHSLMVTTWSFVPRFVGMILFALQGLVLDTSDLRGIMQASFGVARFLDPDTISPGLLAILARVEVFTIWSTILIGIGIAVVGRIPRAKAMTAAVVVWCLGTLPGVWQLLRG